jgi:hypothetical protein
MNNESEKIAAKIASNANAKNQNFAIDPILILMLAGLIVNLIRLWMACKDKSDIHKQMKKPSYLFRFLLRKEVNKNFAKDKRQEIYDSIIDVSKELSEQEVNNLLDEVEKRK